MRALLVLIFAVPTCAQQNFQFTTQTAQFPSNIAIADFAVADFNGDGHPDFAMVDRLTYSIWIALGDGSGNFAEASGSRFHAGNGPKTIVAADFNGDGKMDLAVLNSFTEPLAPFRSAYAIFFGDGLGGFTPGPVQITSAVASSLVSADFNHDGLADLAIGGTDGISILLNDGAANFRLMGNPFGSSVITLVAGDFNKDGATDLAALESAAATVYLGTGMGSFTKSSTLPIPTDLGVPAGAVADFTSDGISDLAVVLRDRVLLFPGDGKGGFSGAISSALSTSTIFERLPVADFNGDGKLDLLLSTPAGALVLQGDGSGKFVEAYNIPVKTPSAIVSSIDANRDGKPDILASSGEVSLNALKTIRTPASLELHASAGQRPLPPIALGSESIPGLTAVADQSWVHFSAGQVIADPSSLKPGTYSATIRFAAPGYFGSSVKVVLQVAAPSGMLTERSTLQLPGRPFYNFLPPQLVDLNGDGKLDLVIASNSNLTFSTWLNDGAGNFPRQTDTPLSYIPGTFATADFDGDGKPDVVMIEGVKGVVLYSGDGLGGFGAGRQTYLAPTYAYSLVTADLNGDGNADLLISSGGDTPIQVFLGDGTGGFREVVAPVSGTRIDYGGYLFQVADFDRDGIPDIAFASNSGRALYIALGKGDGHFGIVQTFILTAEDRQLRLISGDWNGDGEIDLAAISSSTRMGNRFPTGLLSVFLGDGSGNFEQRTQPISSVQASENLGTADFDGDGYLDLVLETDNGTTTILFGTGDGGFVPRAGYVLQDTYQTLTGDLNGDGRADLLRIGKSNYGVLLGELSTAVVQLTQEPDSPFSFRQTIALDVSVIASKLSFNRPEGTVSLFDGTSLAGTTTLNNGTARFLLPFNAGRHEFRAVYSGSPIFPQAAAVLTSVETGVPALIQSLGNAFPLRAKVSDSNGNPVAGAGVIFASGSTSSVALTDVLGIATASLVPNNVPGDYVVTATVSGYTGLSVIYQLRN